MKRLSVLSFMLLCFSLLMVVGCSRPPADTNQGKPVPAKPFVDKTKFANAWAAYKGLEAATSVGVTYVQFGPLLQKFAAEVMLVPKANLSDREAAHLRTLSTMVQAYTDSASLWSLKFDDSTHNDDYVWIVKRGGQKTFDRALEVASQYNLPIRTNSDGAKLLSADSVQILWAFASSKGEALAPDLAP